MKAIHEALKQVYDPELGVNVMDLGLIYEVKLQQNHVDVQMTLTTPGCPLHDTIVAGVEQALLALPEVSTVLVEVVWSPPWTPARMSAAAREVLG